MTTFDDPVAAQRTRDAITNLMIKILDQERPPYQYGTVTQIDPDLGSCLVLLTGDTTAVRVRFGAMRPAFVNQVVRVSGNRGDRFISDVIGGAVVADVPTTSLVAPTGFTMTGEYKAMSAYWNTVTGAAKYELQFADNAGFTTNLRSFTLVGNQYTQPNLNPGQVVHGRVRALTSSNQTGPWSTATSATVTDVPVTSLTDGVAPTASPQPTVTAGIGHLMAQWLPQSNNDLVTYEVHVSTTSGFTPSASTKVGETTGTFYFIRTLQSGAVLAYGTLYYVRLIAKDRDGSAPVGAQGSGTVLQVETGDVGRIATSEIGDGVAPASSPAAVVTNGIGYLYVTWVHPANADALNYDVHVSTTSGFTPSTNTLVGNTPSNFFFVRKQGPGGSPANGDLVYGTTYYVRLIAKDVDGQAAVGAQGSGTPLKTNTVDIQAGAVTNDELGALAVTSAKIAAASVTTEKLTVGSVGQDAVRNGGFEDVSGGDATKAASWTYRYNVQGAGCTSGFLTSGQRTGARSVSLAGATATDGEFIVSQAIPVAEGEVWYIAAYGWANVATTSGRYLRIGFGDTETFAYPGTSFVDIGTASGPFTTTPTKYDGQVTVPAGRKFMRIMVAKWTTNVIATAYWDDVTAQKVTITAQIADGAILAAKIATDAVTADKIKAGEITAAKMVTGTITAASGIIADAAIGTAKIVDANITTAKIADLNVSTAKIADGAIQTAKIGDAQITTAKIGDLQVTTAKIASLAADKILTGTLAATVSITLASGATISSSNFVTNSTGWRILGDGTAEFQGVTIRGTLKTANSGARIEIGTAVLNQIDFYGASVKEARIYSAGGGVINMESGTSGGGYVRVSASDVQIGNQELNCLAGAIIQGASLEVWQPLNMTGGHQFACSYYGWFHYGTTANEIRIGEIYGNGGLYKPSGILRIDCGGGALALSAANGNMLSFSSGYTYFHGRAPDLGGASLYTKGAGDNTHRLFWNGGDDGTHLVSWNRVVCASVQWDINNDAGVDDYTHRVVNNAESAWRTSKAFSFAPQSDLRTKDVLRSAPRGHALGAIRQQKPFFYKNKYPGWGRNPPGVIGPEMFGISATDLPSEMQVPMGIGDLPDLMGYDLAQMAAYLWGGIYDLDLDHTDTLNRLAAAEARIAVLEGALPV